MAIKVPNFKKLTDKQLHNWEFRLYGRLPVGDDRELVDIIGKSKTRAYYDERGRRNDLATAARLEKEIAVLAKVLKATQKRLAANKSGQHLFGRTPGVYK